MVPRSSLRQMFTTLIWPRRRLLSLGLGLIVVNRLAGLVLPASAKTIIDRVLLAEDWQILNTILLAVGAAVAVQTVTSLANTWLISIAAQRQICDMRIAIQHHLLGLPTSFFDDHQTGELVSRVMNDVDGVRNVIGTGLIQFIGGIIGAFFALSYLLYLSLELTAVAVVPLILFVGLALFALRRLRPIHRRRRELQANVTGRLTETLGGIRVVKGFGSQDAESKVFADGVDGLFAIIRKSVLAGSLVGVLATLLLGITTISVAWYGTNLVASGALTAGDFVSFIIFMAVLVLPVIQVADIGSQLTQALAGLDRVQELMAEPGEAEDPRRTRQLGPIDGHFVFEAVSFEYDAGNPVLEEVSFEARPGSVTALVGSSGAGKSTLAALAAGFRSPSTGRVLLDGIDLAEVDLASYRSQLGLVLQEEFLFSGTIRQNIRFPRPDASEQDFDSAVRAAHVSEFTDRLADGLDTVIGERGVKLSGGQRQRVAIARALLADPRVLVLDEATSDLDVESERFIQDSLEELVRDRTTLVIAHRLSTIRRADQILVVEHGRIVERGAHDELMATDGRYAELYEYQARI